MFRRLSARLHHEPPAWLLVTAIIFFILLITASAAYWSFLASYKNRIFPGVFVGKINVSGLNHEQAFTRLSQAVDSYEVDGLRFKFQDKAMALKSTQALDQAASSNYIDFDLNKTTDAAYGYGRESDFLTNLFMQLQALLNRHIITPSYAINDKAIVNFLTENFAKNLNISENAKLAYSSGTFTVVPEKNGYTFDFSSAITKLENIISRLDSGLIDLQATIKTPAITANNLSPIVSQANTQLGLGNFSLHYKDKVFTVKPDSLGQWLAATSTNESINLTLNEEEIIKYLNAKIAPKVEIAAIDARFAMKNGKTVAFTSPQDGLAIAASTTINNINNAWLIKSMSSTSLAMNIIPAQSASSSDATELGIKELIGIGTSNFAGSPANRRHNIKIGISYLNGLLIPPGETFSVMKHLGSIDASKGYLEELVIKKDKTQKEFGGGLCQVGTTVFRAALNTGLPIIERRNHSYRVSYYEPAGTDATVYDPSPDLKFRNDTTKHILIQSYMKGNILTFEFWGTKDGRIAYQSYPKIYNIVKPPATRIVETTTLKPGQKKCTEHAHNGADAYFNYKVTYANGEVKSKQFNSHYVPWQEVCLLGVSQLSTSSSSKNVNILASSTPVKTTSNLATTSKAVTAEKSPATPLNNN